MTLYLIRHGESQTNRTKHFAGQKDFPLTELGHRQAQRLAMFFEDISLDAVYSSDLLRAMDTVTPTARSQGLVVQPKWELREVYAGEWEGMAFEELPRKYPDDFAVWQHNIGAVRCTGGESMEEAVARAQQAIHTIAKAHPDGCVAVASHGAIIRGLIAVWSGGSLAAMQDTPWAPNASVTEIEIVDGRFCVNCLGLTAHLSDLVTELPKTI